MTANTEAHNHVVFPLPCYLFSLSHKCHPQHPVLVKPPPPAHDVPQNNKFPHQHKTTGKSVFFMSLLTVHQCIICSKLSQLAAHYFLVYLFQLLYMFRATMCLSSGELTVSMRHWYFSLCVGGRHIPTSRPRLPPTHAYLLNVEESFLRS